MEWKTDTKYLRGLTQTLDYFFGLVKTGDERLTEMLRENGIPGKFDTKPYGIGVEVILDYFGSLTLKAVEDRELAERLIPIFREAVEKKNPFSSMFVTCAQLLKIAHGERGDEEALEEWLKKIEKVPPAKTFLKHPYDLEALKRSNYHY